MASGLTVIVTGLIAQHPRLGGMTWHYLHYLLGLQRCGHDVYYVEDSGEWPYNYDGGPTGDDWVDRDGRENVRHLAAVMARFGLADRWAYHLATTGQWFGLPDARRAAVIASADLLVNVSGTLVDPQRYRGRGCLAYIDSDPAFTQIRFRRGDAGFEERVAAHDVHFTFGEAVSPDWAGGCCRWRPTRQPIVLAEWPCLPPERRVLTTVMSWTSYPPLVFEGRRWGMKDVEFRRFVLLPRLAGTAEFEIALGGTQHMNWESRDADLPAEVADWLRGRAVASVPDLLRHFGWRVVRSIDVCAGIDAYRRYIQASAAEWSVAKHGYVVSRTGWFSERSACYLAAGRPVVVQDTGFSSVLPTGTGLIAFSTLDEAVAGIHAIEGDYARHAAAARAIAEAYFDSGRVLDSLVEEALSA